MDGGLHYGFFRDLLARHYTSEQVTAKLEVATDWGCYAELYSYDANHTEFWLDPTYQAEHPGPSDAG